MLQSMTVSCRGGLDLSSNVQELLNRPGEAIQLMNYECSKEGGYRRISGFHQFGTEALPDVRAVKSAFFIDNQGVVVAVGDAIYHSFDGTYWLQINKDVDDADETTLASATIIPRTDSTRYQFEVHKVQGEQRVYMTDGAGDPMYLKIEGNERANARYTFREITLNTDLTGAKVAGFFKDHFIIAGMPNNPEAFYYSSIASTDVTPTDGNIFPQEKFDGSTSGYIGVNDTVVGVKSFREVLYIFCQNSIWKATGLESGQPVVQPVTRDIGCIDGNTIQEIGGNLLFLAPDGIRTVAGTEKIGDVELGIISRKIQPLLDEILKEYERYQFASVVLRNKNQYRLFFSDPLAPNETTQGGIIAAYIYNPNGGGASWDFSQVEGFEVSEINSGFYLNREEVIHGNFKGLVARGERGFTFNGTAIKHVFQSPYIDFGDIGVRKNVHKVFLTMKPEGTINLGMEIRYDYQSSDVMQPELYELDQITGPAVFGSGVFGSSIYGARDLPNRDVYTEGSGHTVSVRIVDTGGADASFDIQSLVYDVIINGRI